MEVIERVLQRFEDKDRGKPQAEIAARLVAEIRAALASTPSAIAFNATEDLLKQARRVRNFSNPDEVFEAVPVSCFDAERSAQSTEGVKPADLRGEERKAYIHEHDCPKAWEFFNRWALGSKLCPSCFKCGRPEPDREKWAIRHLNLPDIYICAACCAPSSTTRIRSLIADDAHAMTFQSLGQYRSALLKEIDK